MGEKLFDLYCIHILPILVSDAKIGVNILAIILLQNVLKEKLSLTNNSPSNIVQVYTVLHSHFQKHLDRDDTLQKLI